MRRDKIYWIYRRRALMEDFNHLDEAKRQFIEHNLEFQIANEMAHSGETSNAIHQHLMHSLSRSYYIDAYEQWYHTGGESPVGSYIRNIAKQHYNMGDSVRQPSIDGTPVHSSMVNDFGRGIMTRIHNITKTVHKTHEPEENITV